MVVSNIFYFRSHFGSSCYHFYEKMGIRYSRPEAEGSTGDRAPDTQEHATYAGPYLNPVHTSEGLAAEQRPQTGDTAERVSEEASLRASDFGDSVAPAPYDQPESSGTRVARAADVGRSAAGATTEGAAQKVREIMERKTREREAAVQREGGTEDAGAANDAAEDSRRHGGSRAEAADTSGDHRGGGGAAAPGRDAAEGDAGQEGGAAREHDDGEAAQQVPAAATAVHTASLRANPGLAMDCITAAALRAATNDDDDSDYGETMHLREHILATDDEHGDSGAEDSEGSARDARDRLRATAAAAAVEAENANYRAKIHEETKAGIRNTQT